MAAESCSGPTKYSRKEEDRQVAAFPGRTGEETVLQALAKFDPAAQRRELEQSRKQLEILDTEQEAGADAQGVDQK